MADPRYDLDDLPLGVTRAMVLADGAGFTMSCEPEVGALLAVLAAAVPPGGRVLELGTGIGVGTAWLLHGLGRRTDVELVTIDSDAEAATLAATAGWPPFVRPLVGDAVEVTAEQGSFDLIFADAQGGKWEGLDVTLGALSPGGQLVVDDMTPERFADAHHEARTAAVRRRLLAHPELVSVPIGWASGIIVCTRRAGAPGSR